eukprot:gene6948-9881_t
MSAGWFMPGALPADFPHSPYLAPPPYECFAAGRPASAECASEMEKGGKANADLIQSYLPPACVAER